jgi:hypothetical protein
VSARNSRLDTLLIFDFSLRAAGDESLRPKLGTGRVPEFM